MKSFDYLEKEIIETKYGVDGMARELKSRLSSRNSLFIIVGVVLCICSSIPLLLSSFLYQQDYILTICVDILLLMIAVSVNLFIRAGMSINSFDKLLQTGNYTIEKKKIAPLIDRISKVYWLLSVAIYLAVSFMTHAWSKTWILWPIAGILFGVVITIVEIVFKTKE